MTPTQASVVCLCCHRILPIRETDARAFALHVSNELGGLTSMYQLLRKADTLRIYDAISLRFLTDSSRPTRLGRLSSTCRLTRCRWPCVFAR